VHLSARYLRIEPVLMWRMIRLSAAGTFQIFIGMASWVLLIRVLSGFGSEALAGYTIAMRVVTFALLPSWGMSNAAATMVGQALGAGKPDRAEKAVWIAGRYNVVFLGIVEALFIILAPQIVALFTQGRRRRALCRRRAAPRVGRIRLLCVRMVLTQAFNGAGDTWTPTLVNLGCFWFWEIPLAWALALHLKLGPHGVFLAVAISYGTLAVVSAILFRRGSWKLKYV
jgi:Na+-driven multidrug efflux pump